MGDLKAGEPFGLDQDLIEGIDWELARKRIQRNVRSDFIHAPHISFIYGNAGPYLISQVRGDLKAGKYGSGLPITIEVPKTFRIRITTASKRLGPSYSRPGSILLPRDRLLYQALADQAAPIVQTKTDPLRSFSHELASPTSEEMFLPTRTCWNKMQKALTQLSTGKDKYILKIDIANFFGSLNQHTLINVLTDAGYPKSLASRLEAILTNYAGERSSRGILQGMYPSDLLGNYYLSPLDKFFEEYNVPSARYVDDIYVFLESVESADRLMRQLIPLLRTYDLVINEAKSSIKPAAALVTEEPDLETLFSQAIIEIAAQIDEKAIQADYGFQTDWEESESEEADETELELKATKILFDSIGDYPGYEEYIERFCLPLFSISGSDYAIKAVLESFRKRPAMSQIYASYLAHFTDQSEVVTSLAESLEDEGLFDWQKMWVIAALSRVVTGHEKAVKNASIIFKDGSRHEALRAAAAIYVGRFGDHAKRKMLSASYAAVSPYVQAAIYFSSRAWPVVERKNAKASWNSLGPLNVLLTQAMSV